jgi:hypothetical protein
MLRMEIQLKVESRSIIQIVPLSRMSVIKFQFKAKILVWTNFWLKWMLTMNIHLKSKIWIHLDSVFDQMLALKIMFKANNIFGSKSGSGWCLEWRYISKVALDILIELYLWDGCSWLGHNSKFDLIFHLALH